MNSAPPPFGFSAEVIQCAPLAPEQAGAQTFGHSETRALASAQPRVPLAWAYIKSQLSAAGATLIDFAVMVLLVEAAGLHYVLATACGSFAGGATAFIANRHWSFRAAHLALRGQALRYALVWLGSVSLNCVLVYAMTDQAGLTYTVSKALTAVLVGACFNFPMHRYYVFR